MLRTFVASPTSRCLAFGTAIVFCALIAQSFSTVNADDVPKRSERDRSSQKFTRLPHVPDTARNKPHVSSIGSQACSDSNVLTQSANIDQIDPGIGIACTGNNISSSLSMARAFVMPATFAVGCVTFGIEHNSGGEWPVHVHLRVGNITGPYNDLITVASSTIIIPNNGGNTLYTAQFAGGAVFNAGDTLIVELHTPSRLLAEGGDGGLIVLGCNNDGQTAPTFVRAPGCGVQDFVTSDQIGFPLSHLLMNVAAAQFGPNCDDANPENEPCGTNVNNGCHDSPNPTYGGLECGMQICGDLSVDANGSIYDVDYYTLNLTAHGPLTKVTATVHSLMPVDLFILNDDCNDIRILRAGVGHNPNTLCVCLPPGVYRVFVGPAALNGYPCSAPDRQYVLSVACENATPRLCCDDESIPTDPLGDPIMPPNWDGNAPVFIDIDEDRGAVPDLYPQYDTSLDMWYEQHPCDPVIGDQVDPDDEVDEPEDELASIGVTGDPEEIMADLDAWEAAIAAQGATETDWLATAPPVGDGPYTPSGVWCPQPNAHYVFGGRDIVLVHGLRLEHLADRFAQVPGALQNWVPPTVFPGSQQNPEFYENGYYKSKAEANWADYIASFLQGSGANNRYLVVCYQCSGRVETAVHSVLTQISDAMRDGTGVVDLSGCGDIQNFGSRSFVILSHSTGALVTDVAMRAAATKLNLNATFIPQQCKAHIAPSGAFVGSHLATAAVGISGYVAQQLPTWPACVLAKHSFLAMDMPLGAMDCGFGPADLYQMITTLVKDSVLVDLVPQNTQAKWGSWISLSPVKTISAVAGHPTKIKPLKYWLHRGIDDGVVNIQSQVPSPNPVVFHPSGFFPDSLGKVFDKGVKLTLANPKRAKKYYKDQKKDRELPSGMAAAGATRWVSPTGMLQPRDQFVLQGRDPHARILNHYSFLQSAASHPTAIRAKQNYPFYETTETLPGFENNWEETRVLTTAAVYQPFLAGQGDISPLLSSTCMMPLREIVRGRKIVFRLNFFGKVFRREVWIWKRTYHLLQNSPIWHQMDYIHYSVLCQSLDCSGASCNPCPGDITGDAAVNANDLLSLLNNWGACPNCGADITGDGVVNANDLLALLNAWGPCP